MIYILLGVVGLALGSFVNALVWRVRMQDKGGLKKKKSPKDLSVLHGRSMCVHCKHVLGWLDLVPVLSWVLLKGRCRYCKKSISWQYPVIECVLAILAVGSYLFWPYELNGWVSWLVLITWIISLVPLLALVIYDIKWMEMPTRIIYALNSIAVIFIGLMAYDMKSWGIVISSIVGSILLGGLFWMIYQISAGRWIGGGDVRFGFAMGVLLGWQGGLLGLALASYLGTALIIVLLAIGKYHKKMRIPFGPFLISATYVSVLFGQQVIDWYKSLAGL
jgi:leader peptidase (prepilin peptidase)/N-methyltransferase